MGLIFLCVVPGRLDIARGSGRRPIAWSGEFITTEGERVVCSRKLPDRNGGEHGKHAYSEQSAKCGVHDILLLLLATQWRPGFLVALPNPIEANAKRGPILPHAHGFA